MRRGEIWWANVATPQRSGHNSRRPVLVVQVNAFNRSNIRTVLVTVLTSNVGLAEAPGNVQLTCKQSGLPKPAVVDVSQILTLDRASLIERVGLVPALKMDAVEQGLRLALAL